MLMHFLLLLSSVWQLLKSLRLFPDLRVLALFLGSVVFVPAIASIALAAETQRGIVLDQDGDYFGFDLRTEVDTDLEQCKTFCIADRQCRAFTYNTSVNWCFLKSDFGLLQSASDAVAGRIIEGEGRDLGAAPELDFLTPYADQVERTRQAVMATTRSDIALGNVGLTERAAAMSISGDINGAYQSWREATALAPQSSSLWASVAKAALSDRAKSSEADDSNLEAIGASIIAYQTSRNLIERSAALLELGRALLQNGEGRAAINALNVSLELVNAPDVAALLVDARQRFGFRVVGNSIDAEAQTPRICVQFSEALTKDDYAPFVLLDGSEPQAISVDDQQLCIDGLKHGQRYDLTLRTGLPSAVNENLQSLVKLSLFIRDRASTLRFTGDNFVLPNAARRGIPIISVNADEARIEIYRVNERALTRLMEQPQFLRQLDSYQIEDLRQNLGEAVWTGEVDIASTLNSEVTTSIPIDEALPERQAGVYVMTATLKTGISEDWAQRATQWFVVSDIGLSAVTGTDGLSVFARSLDSARSMSGIQIKLLARNNEVLGDAITDATGKAIFAPGLTRGTDGLVPATLIASTDAGDFVFLDMTRAGFDLSDRGVTGRPAAGALDVSAWTERGVYRAGETVHGQALARDGAANAVDNLPLVFVFTRPDGVEDRRLISDGAALGGSSVDLNLAANAQRGAWRMQVYVDPKRPALADTVFLVEDFVPDRVEFTLEGEAFAVSVPSEIRVDGRFLYGAPAAGLNLEGETIVRPSQDWSLFPSYVFGLSDEDAGNAETRWPLKELPMLDENGQARFDISFDDVPDTTRMLVGDIVVRMRENGGRAVERVFSQEIMPQDDMIGIRPNFADGQLPEGATARFDVIMANPDGQRIEGIGLNWSLVKLERNYQWFREGDSWRYEPITFTTKIANGLVDAGINEVANISVPVGWGRYRFEVEDGSGDGAVSSTEFDGGYYVPMASIETPDGLEIALDKARYVVGDVARLRIAPRFAGEALITIGAENIVQTLMASVPDSGFTLDIPVSADWGAGAYVTVTLVRPGADQSSRMPMRAIGTTWLSIDPGMRNLAIAMDAPDIIRPNAPLNVELSIAGLKTGEEGYVTLAVVDVGILNLTTYQPPAPDAWYFGQRRMGLEIRDLYGRLIDGSAGTVGRLRTGGDGISMGSKGSPPTEKLLALYSGIVRVNEAGKAFITFDMPQFNGSARLMAVGWSQKGVGHLVKDVTVRDPVVIVASTPPFLAIGDQATMLVEFANVDGPAGNYRFDVTTSDELSVDQPTQIINLDARARMSVNLTLDALQIGKGSLGFTLKNSTGVSLAFERDINVRGDALAVTQQIKVVLAANGGSVRVDRELLADSILTGASVSVAVSQNTLFDVPSLLMSLDRYPYGCSEQTTSRALPLLYVSELSQAAGLPDDLTIRERVQSAIDQVLNNQSSAGSFGLWRPGNGDLWLDSYVSDFLTRAREKNFVVPDQAMKLALQNLQNTLAYTNETFGQSNELAYALYVLARNRQASLSDLRYYAESQIDQFTTAMARAQLAAALALYGDQDGATRAFDAALDLAGRDTDLMRARSDYGSPLRDSAAMVALAAETSPAPINISKMLPVLDGLSKKTPMMSTQDQAWMVLASRALSGGNDAIVLNVNGMVHEGSYAETFEGRVLDASPLILRNEGADLVEASITIIAAPKQALPAGGDGFTIDRRYYTLDGTETNLAETRQNDRLVVVLTMIEQNKWPSRLLVTDLLPAGLEIDNPRLVRSAELPNFSWLGDTEAAHSEYRDDRFVVAFNRSANDERSFSLAYVVRAVTPGTYVQPAATVEDMYRPQLSARTATGRIRVLAN